MKVISTGSIGNSYVIHERGKFIVLDLGVNIQEIKRGVNFRVSDIDMAFVSHGHKDHCKSEDKIRKMGIDVFAPYHDDNLMQVHKTRGWYMKSFPLFHGEDVKNCGVYIMSPEGHKLVYASDCQRIDHKFTKLGINTFLIECNHDDIIDKGLNEGKWEHSLRDHASVSTVCEFLRVNQTDKLRNVILCHASENNLNEPEAIRRIREVIGEDVNLEIAKRGMIVYL